MTDADIFEKYGCVLVQNFVDEETISVVSQYFENKLKRGEWLEGAEGPVTVSKLFYYADPLIEVILQKSKGAVEDVVCKELLPTYSYSRIYRAGEELKPHVDRPSCEVSATINVASMGSTSPIYMKYEDAEPQKYILNPGDAVIYKGCEVTHWRDPLENDQLNVQFMLHYVDKNGPNAVFEKDKRPAYGFDSVKRSQ